MPGGMGPVVAWEKSPKGRNLLALRHENFVIKLSLFLTGSGRRDAIELFVAPICLPCGEPFNVVVPRYSATIVPQYSLDCLACSNRRPGPDQIVTFRGELLERSKSSIGTVENWWMEVQVDPLTATLLATPTLECIVGVMKESLSRD